MTERLHVPGRVDAHDPCPFCGCGPRVAVLRKPRRKTAYNPFPQFTLAQLPDWWQQVMRRPLVWREPTAGELRYVAALKARAGWRAVVGDDNAVIAWENPETGEREEVAA